MIRRIIHLLDTLGVGGAEMLVLQLCRRQREVGLEPEVHWLLDSGPLESALRREAIPVHGYAATNSLPEKFRLWRDMAGQFGRSPVILHSHNANAAILGAIPAAWKRVPHLCTRHGLVPPDQFRSREARFWTMAPLLDRIVAVCDAAAANLRAATRRHRSKIVTVRNGALAPARSGTLAPREQGLVAITVARLSAAKDQATLLRAFNAAHLHVPDLSLWIVGDGEERAVLEGLAASLRITSSVRFWGQRHSIGSFLDAAHIFVLSSISEGLPVSLLEAMEAGIPQIVTDVGGMPEVVRLAKSGIVVPPRDVEALASALVELSRDESRRCAMASSARHAYQQHFTLECMYQGYLRLYEELSRTRHP